MGVQSEVTAAVPPPARTAAQAEHKRQSDFQDEHSRLYGAKAQQTAAGHQRGGMWQPKVTATSEAGAPGDVRPPGAQTGVRAKVEVVAKGKAKGKVQPAPGPGLNIMRFVPPPKATTIPLSAKTLAASHKPMMFLGEHVYRCVSDIQPNRAQEITGLMLENVDNKVLIECCKHNRLMQAQVTAAMERIAELEAGLTRTSAKPSAVVITKPPPPEPLQPKSRSSFQTRDGPLNRQRAEEASTLSSTGRPGRVMQHPSDADFAAFDAAASTATPDPEQRGTRRESSRPVGGDSSRARTVMQAEDERPLRSTGHSARQGGAQRDSQWQPSLVHRQGDRERQRRQQDQNEADEGVEVRYDSHRRDYEGSPSPQGRLADDHQYADDRIRRDTRGREEHRDRRDRRDDRSDRVDSTDGSAGQRSRSSRTTETSDAASSRYQQRREPGSQRDREADDASYGFAGTGTGRRRGTQRERDQYGPRGGR